MLRKIKISAAGLLRNSTPAADQRRDTSWMRWFSHGLNLVTCICIVELGNLTTHFPLATKSARYFKSFANKIQRKCKRDDGLWEEKQENRMQATRVYDWPILCGPNFFCETWWTYCRWLVEQSWATLWLALGRHRGAEAVPWSYEPHRSLLEFAIYRSFGTESRSRRRNSVVDLLQPSTLRLCS